MTSFNFYRRLWTPMLMMAIFIVLIPGSSHSIDQHKLELVPRVVLKLVVGDKQLQKYFHPEALGGMSLIVSDHLLADGITPSVFGKPVTIMGDKQIGDMPHLRIIKYNVKGKSASLAFDYTHKNIRVDCVVTEDNGWWSISDMKITEIKKKPLTTQ